MHPLAPFYSFSENMCQPRTGNNSDYSTRECLTDLFLITMFTACGLFIHAILYYALYKLKIIGNYCE